MPQPTLSQLGFREGLAPSEISVEKLSSVVVPAFDRPNGDSNVPPLGVAATFSVDKYGAEARSRPTGAQETDGHASELSVGSERLPFDATGGILLRLVFSGGPNLSFFLCELGSPVFLELVSVCTQMFGTPLLADPRRRTK